MGWSAGWRGGLLATGGGWSTGCFWTTWCLPLAIRGRHGQLATAEVAASPRIFHLYTTFYSTVCTSFLPAAYTNRSVGRRAVVSHRR